MIDPEEGRTVTNLGRSPSGYKKQSPSPSSVVLIENGDGFLFSMTNPLRQLSLRPLLPFATVATVCTQVEDRYIKLNAQNPWNRHYKRCIRCWSTHSALSLQST